MKASIFGCAVLLAISGCATSPISIKEARSVPPERVFLSEKLPVEGNAQAVFLRDVGVTGSGVYQHLFVNGKKAASLDPREKVEFVLPPGEHIFGVIPTDPFGVHALNTIDQELRAGRRYFYRIQTDGNSFRTFIQRSLPEAE